MSVTFNPGRLFITTYNGADSIKYTVVVSSDAYYFNGTFDVLPDSNYLVNGYPTGRHLHSAYEFLDGIDYYYDSVAKEITTTAKDIFMGTGNASGELDVSVEYYVIDIDEPIRLSAGVAKDITGTYTFGSGKYVDVLYREHGTTPWLEFDTDVLVAVDNTWTANGTIATQGQYDFKAVDTVNDFIYDEVDDVTVNDLQIDEPIRLVAGVVRNITGIYNGGIGQLVDVFYKLSSGSTWVAFDTNVTVAGDETWTASGTIPSDGTYDIKVVDTVLSSTQDIVTDVDTLIIDITTPVLVADVERDIIGTYNSVGRYVNVYYRLSTDVSWTLFDENVLVAGDESWTATGTIPIDGTYDIKAEDASDTDVVDQLDDLVTRYVTINTPTITANISVNVTGLNNGGTGSFVDVYYKLASDLTWTQFGDDIVVQADNSWTAPLFIVDDGTYDIKVEDSVDTDIEDHLEDIVVAPYSSEGTMDATCTASTPTSV